MKKITTYLFLSILLLSCSNFRDRRPSSDDESLTLSQIIADISIASKNNGEDKSHCKLEYDELYKRLFELAGETTYFDLNDIKTIDREIQESFKARLLLKDSFKNFKIEGSTDNECLKSAMDVFRGLRYVEDYLIELRMDKVSDAPLEYISLKGEFPYLLVNPKFSDDFKSYEDLKSGDVILSRGNAFSSAAIARIGQSDYQFSHLSFVYKELESKEVFTTEAHIEIGSVIAPIIEHINGKNAREVVFRYYDEKLSSEASKLIYNRVKDEQIKGVNIQYDFSMNFKDSSKLFCSEIIASGFKMAAPNEDYLPMFKSRFSSGIIPFLNTIGVPATKENVQTLEVFSPGDIQFDPRFELVAEWRNPRKMEESRYKDFILTKVFEYMEKENYQIDPTLVMETKSKTFWLMRRLPVVRKFIQNHFPLNMKPEQLQLFMALDKIGDAIYKEVEKTSLEYDRPMTPKEIYAVTEEFFKRDFEHYKRYKKGQEVVKPAFHLLFHP